MLPNIRPATLLVILDGFGFSKEKSNNAISMAQTPNWSDFLNRYPSHLIQTSGEFVGLPQGQMGNSEVGHMTIGAGRVIYQDLPRINRAIENGEFQQNPVLLNLIGQSINNKSAIHLIGLLSEGGVHSHESQIHAVIQLCKDKKVDDLRIHAILDGRDTPPKSAEQSLSKLEEVLEKTGVGQISTVSGRFFAMDRDQRWDRVELAFKAIALGESSLHASSAKEALLKAYARGESDEFVSPTVVRQKKAIDQSIKPSDSILFMNFRADRAREISRSLTDKTFAYFNRDNYKVPAEAATLTKYAEDINLPVIFNRESHRNTLGEYLSNLNMTQLRIAETEKYAHVTFFFSGGREKPFTGEKRVLIPSPKVATYDLQPQMSAPEITDKIIESVESREFDLIVANYANGDMVGHTGKLEPTIKAVEILDECIGKLELSLTEDSDQMLITSDHGNAEQMRDPKSQEEHTAHTNNLVPLVCVSRKSLNAINKNGTLSDIAPTILKLMDIDIPKEMTGQPLFEKSKPY